MEFWGRNTKLFTIDVKENPGKDKFIFTILRGNNIFLNMEDEKR